MSAKDIVINGKPNKKPEYKKRYVIYLVDKKGYLKRGYEAEVHYSRSLDEAISFPNESIATAYASRKGLTNYEVRPTFMVDE